MRPLKNANYRVEFQNNFRHFSLRCQKLLFRKGEGELRQNNKGEIVYTFVKPRQMPRIHNLPVIGHCFVLAHNYSQPLR